MKKFLLFAVSAVALSMLTGCNDSSDSDNVTPSVQISLSNADITSLSINVNPVNAVKCAYTVIGDGETVPSADEILQSGKPAHANEASVIVIDNLEPNTPYQVVAAVQSISNEKVAESEIFSTADVPAIAFDATRATGKHYGTTNNLGVTLRTLDNGIDYELSLDIYDDSAKTTNVLGNGTYTLTNDSANATFNAEYSYVQMGNDQLKFTSGVLTVETNATDNTYKLELRAALSNGEYFHATFEGTISGFTLK